VASLPAICNELVTAVSLPAICLPLSGDGITDDELKTAVSLPADWLQVGGCGVTNDELETAVSLETKTQPIYPRISQIDADFVASLMVLICGICEICGLDLRQP
jgi:hypothetical protein